jgi:uncharacterized protein YcbX
MGRPRVATVAAIGRYPVKSMRAEPLDAATITWNGLLGDRRWAFVRADTPADFPWLTGRQHAPLTLYTPRFERPPSVDEPEPPLWVTTPDGEVYTIDDSRLRAELAARSGYPLWLLHQNRGCFDSAHLSLIGQPTLGWLSEAVGRPLEPERFRANLYLEPATAESFAEDAWVGRTLQIGDETHLGVIRRNKRCVMTTLDPATAAADPAVLRTIVQRREECLGVYASVLAAGGVRIGDPVYLVD